jgi:hypothetical protein
MRAALLLAASAGAVALLFGRSARAEGPFVDAPLTLPPLHFSADVGLGFGTFQNYATNPTNPSGPTVLQGGTQVGWGMNLEADVGLPYVGQLGLRIGYRFGPGIGANSGDPEATSVPAGALGNADHFGRLFDPIQSEPGISSIANPEVLLRGNLIDLRPFQLGLETRVIIPTGDGSVFALTPGVPMRIHLPGFMRIDTGLYLPVAFFSTASYSLDVPVQVFFQVGSAFFGPMTGLRYNVLETSSATTCSRPRTTRATPPRRAPSTSRSGSLAATPWGASWTSRPSSEPSVSTTRTGPPSTSAAVSASASACPEKRKARRSAPGAR